MPFVLDAFVALAEEDLLTAVAALALIRNDEGCAPSLWWFAIITWRGAKGRTSLSA
jgi:hypothetical protein